MARPHLLRTYDGWISRAEAEGTEAGRVRAERRRRELARIEAALGQGRGVWIGAHPDALEPVTRDQFDTMTPKG